MGNVYPANRFALTPAGREQAAVDEGLQCAGKKGRVVSSSPQVGLSYLAAGIGPAFAKLDQTQKDAPGDGLGGRGQVFVDDTGPAVDGDLQPVALALSHPRIGRGGQIAPGHLLPEQAQTLLHQRQCAFLPCGVAGQPLHQQGIDAHFHLGCGLDNRRGQFGPAQGRQVQPVGADGRPEGAAHQFRVEIGAHGEENVQVRLADEGLQGVEKGLDLGRVGLGEEFLELVDKEEGGRTPL